MTMALMMLDCRRRLLLLFLFLLSSPAVATNVECCTTGKCHNVPTIWGQYLRGSFLANGHVTSSRVTSLAKRRPGPRGHFQVTIVPQEITVKIMPYLNMLLSLHDHCACASCCSLEVHVIFRGKRANYPVKVSDVDVSPYPIARGKPATFTISANTGTEISEGKLIIDVKYFGIHVHQETHDLCKEISCPISAGDYFVLSHEQTLPSYTPPGSYTLTMKLTGETGKQLTCVVFDFSIGSSSSSSSVADSRMMQTQTSR